MVDKVMAIRERLGDAMGVLEGWGDYLLEGIPAGISGVMPGVAIADLFDMVFGVRARVARQGWRVFRLFAAALPMIASGLHNTGKRPRSHCTRDETIVTSSTDRRSFAA